MRRKLAPGSPPLQPWAFLAPGRGRPLGPPRPPPSRPGRSESQRRRRRCRWAARRPLPPAKLEAPASAREWRWTPL
eukprot:15478004-Alexandrium_andersonii.AAC.1